MQWRQVKKRGHQLTLNTCGWDFNIYMILGDKYNYVIDTGLGDQSILPVRAFLEKEEKPTIVINTHYHWDHIWGNEAVSDWMIVAHEACREMIQSQWQHMMERSGEIVHGKTAMRLPDLVFDTGMFFPEDQIRLIYTPGHTIDSISVFDEKEKVLHVGDNVGDTVDEMLPSMAGGVELYLKTLQRYREIDFDTCVSGHNTVHDKSFIDVVWPLVEQSQKGQDERIN